MISADQPLRGECACGAVRFRVTAPFESSGYCHCTRCQGRAGTGSSVNASVAATAFEVLEGEDAIRTWRPPGGNPKSFCVHCGGHLFSGDRERGTPIGVRLGLVDGDPGIRPEWRQWVAEAPVWDSIPDDGLPRFPGSRRAPDPA